MPAPASRRFEEGASGLLSTTGSMHHATRRKSLPFAGLTGVTAEGAAFTLFCAETAPAPPFLNSVDLTKTLGRTRPPDGAQPRMQAGTAQKVSNAVLSGAAGVASFIFSLSALL